MTSRNEIHLQQVVGKGYADFWKFHGRYRVVKGSRASKKSRTMALWLIYHIMRYPEANALVVRKVFRTLGDSCFAVLNWATERLGVADQWRFTSNPMKAVYLPTGQVILFRGLDDAEKLSSITVSTGYLCWVWIEEAYELTKESDFDLIDETIRGEIPEELWKQVTLTFNPWNERHWLKGRFFDPDPTPDVMAKTTDYRCNEWGIVEGLIYENWREEAFTLEDIRTRRPAGGFRPRLRPAYHRS